MTDQNETTLRVIELRAENVKRLHAVTIRPDGNMILIGGKNGAGKSSTLDAIEMALGGTKTIPADPVRHGARKARIVADLGELRIERTFSSKGSKLVVTNADGVPQKSPQTLLDAMCASIAFDPFAFTRETPPKQDAILKEAVGLDFSELDAKRAAAYEERTNVNRERKQAEARLKDRHACTPPKEVSVAELSKELEAALKTCGVYKEEREAADKVINRVAEAKSDIETTEREIKEVEDKLRLLKEDLTEKNQALLRAQVAADKARDSVAQLVDPDPEPIRKQIAEAEETNRKVRHNAEQDKLEQEIDKLEARVEQLSEVIREVDEEKAARLAAAEFPVPGLGFDDTGPTLNGIPLEQCSQAERLRLSVAIGAALNPRIKVMLVREGAFLDKDSLRLLAELAEEVGAQVWVERVGDGDEAAIIIEDGAVRDDEEAAAE